jgi:hypothetical protein
MREKMTPVFAELHLTSLAFCKIDHLAFARTQMVGLRRRQLPELVEKVQSKQLCWFALLY